ncbi:MAG: disulfide bond formation protein DsbA, partial [Oscillochloris sp.]|nr:disulfide bond formation protein DsbA [Oscillochloris sp.]
SATPEPTPKPTATPAPVLYNGAPEGRDAAGAFALGDPSAPRTLYEYSDFL